MLVFNNVKTNKKTFSTKILSHRERNFRMSMQDQVWAGDGLKLVVTAAL